MRIFFDTEFTGLHQNTTLISIGLVAENGREFYGEFIDYDKDQINDWLQENVINKLIYRIDKLIYKSDEKWSYTDGMYTSRLGNKTYIRVELENWLDSFNESIEMWSDCLAYDWVLFCQLWGGALNVPDWIYYIPFDLTTLFKIKGIDPDINKEDFLGQDWVVEGSKHNALYDAKVIKGCYEKVLKREACEKDEFIDSLTERHEKDETEEMTKDLY